MMDDRRPRGQVRPGPAGLCEGCAHVRLVTSAHGSTFYLCRLSFMDDRFPRYPPIPVLACAGFVSREPPGTSTG